MRASCLKRTPIILPAKVFPPGSKGCRVFACVLVQGKVSLNWYLDAGGMVSKVRRMAATWIARKATGQSHTVYTDKTRLDLLIRESILIRAFDDHKQKGVPRWKHKSRLIKMLTWTRSKTYCFAQSTRWSWKSKAAGG